MKFIQTDNALKPNGHYSQAVIHGGLMFVSGQLAVNPETGEKEFGKPEEEFKRILSNLDLILQNAGITKNHILKTTVFISDISLWPQINGVYADYFGDHKPARSVVTAPELHFGYKVEMEVIATLWLDA